MVAAFTVRVLIVLRASLIVLGLAVCTAATAQLQILFRDQMDHPDTQRAEQAISDRQYAKALEILPARAEAGDAAAQILLGVMHRDGLGGPRNGAEALKWLSRAAAQTTAKHDLALIAASILGKMYDDGLAVPRDVTEALRWYKQSGWAGEQRYRNLFFFRQDTPVIIREGGYDDYDPRTLQAAAERNAYARRLTERLRERVVRPPEFPRGAYMMFDVGVDASGNIASVADIGVGTPDNVRISQDVLQAARKSITESVRNSGPWPLPPAWISRDRKVRIQVPDQALLEAERKRDPSFPSALAGRHALRVATKSLTLEMTLDCVAKTGCRFTTISTEAAEKPFRTEHTGLSVEAATNVTELRNALAYSRTNAAQVRAGQRPFLDSLRPHFERELEQCHALLGERGGSLYFCTLKGSPTLLHFWPIMECGGDYCGYAVLPLTRAVR